MRTLGPNRVFADKFDAAEPVIQSFITRRLVRLVTGIPPHSWKAAFVAVSCFLTALSAQMLFRSLGGSVLFATYFPAVMIAGLLAGRLAGSLVLASSLL